MIYLITTLNIKPGCIRSDHTADGLDDTKLVFDEELKTREDLTQHFEQPHMAV